MGIYRSSRIKFSDQPFYNYLQFNHGMEILNKEALLQTKAEKTKIKKSKVNPS